MSQMKELYVKVAADVTLQEKFTEIIKNAEAAGKEATRAKQSPSSVHWIDTPVGDVGNFFK